MSECEIVKSKRGKDILIYKGYSYHLNNKRDSKYYWRCTRSGPTRCNVSVTSRQTTSNIHNILSQNQDHMHLPNPGKRIELKLKANLKEKANQSFDSPSQIFQRCIQMVPSTSAPHMPNKIDMRRIIQRERNKNLQSIPKDIRNIVIPDELA